MLPACLANYAKLSSCRIEQTVEEQKSNTTQPNQCHRGDAQPCIYSYILELLNVVFRPPNHLRISMCFHSCSAPDILFLKHDSSILRQSSNPSFSKKKQVRLGPQRAGMALPWTPYRVGWLSENATVCQCFRKRMSVPPLPWNLSSASRARGRLCTRPSRGHPRPRSQGRPGTRSASAPPTASSSCQTSTAAAPTPPSWQHSKPRVVRTPKLGNVWGVYSWFFVLSGLWISCTPPTIIHCAPLTNDNIPPCSNFCGINKLSTLLNLGILTTSNFFEALF